MTPTRSISRNIAYGRKLARAGGSGIRAGHHAALDGRHFSSVLADTARDSLMLAAVGVCVGLLRSYLAHRNRRISRTIAYGALGGTVGFVAGFGWSNRRVTSTLAHSALKEMHKASDEHWLEGHPIDYA